MRIGFTVDTPTMGIPTYGNGNGNDHVGTIKDWEYRKPFRHTSVTSSKYRYL